MSARNVLTPPRSPLVRPRIRDGAHLGVPPPAARRFFVIGCAAAFVWLATIGAPHLAAQESNLSRLRRCATAIADSALAGLHSGDTVRLHVADHPGDWLLEQATVGVASDRGIVVARWQSERFDPVSLAITDLRVEYRPAGSDDSLERVATMTAGATTTDRRGAVDAVQSRSLMASIVDTVGAGTESALESSGYEFARGIYTKPAKRGFWDTIVEPFVVLGAAVVMVVLLFTVRSQ